ncbi:MAG: FHA domain-containing protein [Burkholderiales bacterium]
MGSVIIAEVLEKSGKVHERIKLARFPAVIGRGYDSDLIVNDEFISAQHVRIALDDAGQFILSDLGTENGTYLLPEMRPVSTLVLGADTVLRLGHTLLRLRRPDCPVAPTRIDTLTRSRFAHYATSNAALFCIALLMLAIVGFNTYQTTVQQLTFSKLMLDILEIAALVPVWAGIWAILGRVFAHHTAYVSHMVIACLGVIGFFAADTLVEYYAFGFSAQLSADILFDLLFGLLAYGILYGHLRFATLLAPRRIGLVAASTAIGLMALSAFTTYVQGLDFNDTLPYPPELKPAQFRVVAEKPLDDFIHAAEKLPQEIQQRD